MCTRTSLANAYGEFAIDTFTAMVSVLPDVAIRGSHLDGSGPLTNRDHGVRHMNAPVFTCRRILTKSADLLGILSALSFGTAQATEPQNMSYWISMRGITEDGQPSFVSLSYVQTSTYSVAFAGCRGRTWYLQSGASATVQAARAAGETVQIHRGEPGSSPQSSTVICLIQADQ